MIAYCDLNQIKKVVRIMDQAVTNTQFDPKPFRTLHVSNWEHATFKERLAALQQLEKYQATLQGRAEQSLQVTDNLPNHFSAMYSFSEKSSEPGTIFIKSSILKENKPYAAVYLLLHEIRHVYQRYCCITPEMVQQDHENDRTLWQINRTQDGYLHKMPDYHLQPSERDADRYALEEMDKIYTRLQETYGRDAKFFDFMLNRQLAIKNLETQAKALYGQQFLNIIDNKCIQKYNLCKEFKNKYFHVTSFDHKFFPIFHKKVEQFVHENNGTNRSFEEFEQSWQNDQAFLQALEEEQARQRFFDQFLQLVGEYHYSPQPYNKIVSLPRQFANSIPTENLSMDAFKAYLIEHNHHDFLKYIERRITEKNTFMENFRNTYGEITDEEIRKRLHHRIEWFLYLRSERDLSIRAFERYLADDAIEVDHEIDLFMYLRKRRKNRSTTQEKKSTISPLPSPTDKIEIISPNRHQNKEITDQR